MKWSLPYSTEDTKQDLEIKEALYVWIQTFSSSGTHLWIPKRIVSEYSSGSSSKILQEKDTKEKLCQVFGYFTEFKFKLEVSH